MQSEKRRKFFLDKRAQLTVFIIIAVIIVAAIIIILYPRIKTSMSPSEPQPYLGDCLKTKLDETIKNIENRGGSVNPVLGINYQGEKIEYLCFTNEYYKICKQQQPLLKQHIENEILENMRATVDTCIENMKTEMQARGYTAQSGQKNLSVEVNPSGVNLIVKADVVFTKENSGERFEQFTINKPSKIYDFSNLAASIINWEATYGDSDIQSFMLYYPNFKVEKYKQDEGSKIYIITDRKTSEKFTFASRSLSWYPGYGFNKIVRP